jgi:hypothetical protein
VPKDDGWNVFVQRPGYPLNTLHLPTEQDARRVVAAITDALKDRAHEHPQPFTVHFTGGPWDGKTYDAERIVAPVFAAGHLIGNHYYLDTKSEPPTYFWDGTEWETVDG